MYTLRGRDLTYLRDGSEAAAAAKSEMSFGQEAGCEPAESPGEAAAPSLGNSIGGLARAAASSPTSPPSVLSLAPGSPGKTTSLPPAPSLLETEAMLQAKAAYCSGRAHRSGCNSRQCNPWRRSAHRSRTGSRQGHRGSAELSSALVPCSPAPESWAQEDSEMTSQLESKLANTLVAGSDATIIEALRSQNQELSERLLKKSQELVRVQDKLHRFEQERSRLIKTQTDTVFPGKCTAPCCLPVARLDKAGLNGEPLSGLDSTWAGYVFSLVSVQVRSSGSTFTEIFRKHRNSSGKMDEAAFRDFIHQFFPNIYEDRLTRLFFFADCDGSGCLNFLEFLRIFGCDLNGKMGEEYFEHVMVRVHRAIGKRGGLSSVLQIRDRNVQVDGSLNRQRMIDLVLDLNVGLNRREAFDLTATFDPLGTGEVQIVEFSDAMNMCASASFVTEEWVHKLFDQVVTMIHTQSRSLHKALEPFAAKGSMNREDLQGFLHQFVPGLRDSQVDRVFTFLLSGNERSASHRNGEIDLSHFFEVVCRPSLGPTVKGRPTDTSLPMEVTERLALQLDRLCGSLSTAFDMLNPCLFIEEFRASLQSLGFAPGMDFTQVFNMLDVHRNGRVQRTTFIQVLQRHVKRLQAVKQANEDSVSMRETTQAEEAAAKSIGRFFRKRLTHARSSVVGVSSAKSFESRLQKQHAMLPIRSVGGAQMVPLSQHTEALRDQQRAINRILVLENELEYARRRLGQGMPGSQDRAAQLEDLRSLEGANHRLSARLREVRSKTREKFITRRAPSPDPDIIDMARSASAPPMVQRHASTSSFMDREEQEKERAKVLAQLREAQDENQSLQLEKIALQEELVATRHKGRVTTTQPTITTPPSPSRDKELVLDIPSAPTQASSDQEENRDDTDATRRTSAGRWGMLRSVSTRTSATSTLRATIAPGTPSRPAGASHESRRKNEACEGPKDTNTAQMLKALAAYSDNLDVRQFLQMTIGLSINNRFTIRGVVTVESDSLVLRCTDAYLRREVAVKLPTVDDLANRGRFLRECVIYSHLLDVTEVQDVYHFPGLCEDMVCCVMELLRGRLLSDHLEVIRKGGHEPLTVYEAAEICDALLYGISECHTRGVVHLDLKPSVVWEVKQPAKVVVKILDFGLAHLANRSLLTADARQLFEKRKSLDEEEDFGLAVDSSADGTCTRVPNIMDRAEKWAEFAPNAILKNWGTPWYMSPARWCSYVIRNQQSSVAARDLRWDEHSAGRNLVIEHGIGDDLDSAHVGSINEQARAVMATETVPQLPEGSYFEIIIRKVWPRHIMQTAMDKQINWPGMGIGFTLTPPPPNGLRLPNYAKDIPKSWVLGYGGRFFIDGREVKIEDMAPEEAINGFRRRQASSSTNFAGEVLGDIMHEMDGPLGWSFGELYRGDRLGIMAAHNGHLEVYVNSHLISKLRVPSLDNQMILYPVVDLCGRFREVGLVPQPRSPAGAYRHHLFLEHRHQVEKLGRRTNMPSNDVIAAALIVQECFSSHVTPTVSLNFVHLLRAIRLWQKHDRPAITESGDILKALYHWSKENRLCKAVPPDIMDVISRVFNGSRGDEIFDEATATQNSNVITNAHQFRMALNEKTSWCHMSPEFLKSHVKNEALDKASSPLSERQQQRLGDKFVAAARQMISGSPQQDQELWDLTPWTLSSSHVRRVVQVLHSAEGDHIGVVSIFRFEPNVPVELMLRLRDCFRGFPALESDSDSDSEHAAVPDIVYTAQAAMIRNPGNVHKSRHSNRQLVFAGVQFPSNLCPVPFAKLQEANAVGLILHFVRDFDLLRGSQAVSPGSIQAPVGPEGASLIATALHRNDVLQHLGACGQGIGDAGTSALSAALQHGTNLRKLDLRSNNISDQGAKALSDTLRRPGCGLQVLDLTHNDIANAGCRYLASMLHENESLTLLNLQRNQIGDEGARCIGDALHHNTTLHELDVGRNHIGVAGAGKLARVTRSNSSLQSLNLQDNALDALVAIALAEALREDVKTPAVKKSNAKRLSQIHDFGGPGPGGLSAGISNLRKLNLRHNALGSAGGADLLRALRGNSRLAVLNLAWNELSGEAAKAFAGLYAAGSVCTLEEVDLRDNLLGEGAAIGLAFLALSFNAPGTPREDSAERSDSEHRMTVKPFRPGSVTSRSSTLGNRQSTSGGRLSTSRPSSGSRFSTSRADSPQRAINARPSSPAIGKRSSTTGPRQTRIGNAKEDGMSITQFDANRFYGVDSRYSAKGFTRSSGLMKTTAGLCIRMLNLANCRLDVKGIGLLAKAMPIFQNLEELYLYNNTGIGPNDSTPNSIPEKIELNDKDSKGVAFADPRPVQGIGADRPGASGAVSSLIDFMSSLSSTLRLLSLGSCMLGTKVTVAVLPSLAGRVALQELDLSDNDLHENNLLIDAIRHFLKTSASIAKLGLALNSMGDSSASTVARLLATTSQDIIVDFAANNVSTEVRDAILCPCKTKEHAVKERGDGGKTPQQSLADALALDLENANFPIRGRLLI